MIPELKCGIHYEEEITRINLSQSDQTINRVLCGECLDSIQNTKTCQLKKIPELILKYRDNALQNIQEEQDPQIKKYNKVKKYLNTLKMRTMEIFDKLEQKLEMHITTMKTMKVAEQNYYDDLLTDITRTKLQEIADLLSGNETRQCKTINYCMDNFNIMNEIAQYFKQCVQLQSQTIKEINDTFNSQLTLKYQFKLEENCWALTCNQKKNIIAGGRGHDLVIWKQNELNLVETQVLTGHQDCITTIIFYQLSDLLVSGGGSDDRQIKIWQNSDEQWKCIQTILDHKARINDMKLSQNEKMLISASDDKLIKVWSQLSNLQLQCIQTLDEIHKEIYWISISFDSIFLASSKDENYFNIYMSEFTDINPWRKFQTIQSTEKSGKLHRIHFLKHNNVLIAQQVNPPKLIILSFNQTNSYEISQEISLNNNNNNDILFPIFSFNNFIILKNSQSILIINRKRNGQFLIEQTIDGDFSTGYSDTQNSSIILSNSGNRSIDFYK